MDILFSEKAERDLDEIEPQLRELFFKHFEKIKIMPPRRHMRFGLPFNVENVTKQARIIYHIENTAVIVIRCFASHKDYEKWYLSFKR